MRHLRNTNKLGSVSLAVLAALGIASPAGAIELREAIAVAIDTNPEINQAAMNREAIDFERRQARRLYGPRWNVEVQGGIRRLENATRRALNIADQTLYPFGVDAVVEQPLLDFGRRGSEVDRQASRVDGAAQRVEERSEFVALNVSRHYLDYLLQERIVAAARDNLAFHQRLVADLSQGVAQGSISIADQQQAEERAQAAQVKLSEAQEELRNAGIAFTRLTGVPIGDATMPPPVSGNLPPNVDQAVDFARDNNPLVLEAMADLDARASEVRAAEAEFAPELLAEGRARIGEDIDGFRGSTEDLQARLVLRWTFQNGLKQMAFREAMARESEQRFRVEQLAREAEADVRVAWNRLESQTEIASTLDTQSRVSDELLVSYREQFNVGRRSLLDVLDAQNTRYNVQVQAETARLAQLFAQYRVLASANLLLEALGLAPHPAAVSNARERHNVPSAYGPATASSSAEAPYGPSVD